MQSKGSGGIDLQLFLLIEFGNNLVWFTMVQLNQLIILRKLLRADGYLGNLIQLLALIKWCWLEVFYFFYCGYFPFWLLLGFMDIWFSFLYIYIDKCMLGSDFSKHFVEIMNVYIAIYSFFCLNIVSDV